MATREILNLIKKTNKTNFDIRKKELIYKDTNKKVINLSILVDYHNGNNIGLNPLFIKVGEYDKVLEYYDLNFKDNNLFNMKILKIPKEMYKWIDAVAFQHKNNWIKLLEEELKSKN